MSKTQKWATLVFIAVLAIIGVAQQQYSGGQVVTIGSGSAVIGHVVVDTAPSTAVTNANLDVALSTRLKPADTLAGVTTVNAVTSITNALPAGTNKLGITYPYTSCGTTAVSQVLVALPTSATAVTGTTSCLVNLYLHNTSSSTAYTVTITDGQGTPVPFLNAVTLNALETRQFSFPSGGPKFTTGLKWQASNVAVTGAVEMMQ